jgi:hypothetical protein
MSAHPRDALERRVEPESPQQTDPGWTTFWKVSFVTLCIATVTIDHVTAKYREVSELAKKVTDGDGSFDPMTIMLSLWVLAALAVVLARDWTEFRDHFSPYLALVTRLIRRTYQKLIKS